MDNGKALGDGERRPAVPPVIRAGCLALSMLGVVSLLLAMPSIVNPGSIRCSLARTYIDDANDDDKKFNDTDIGGREVDTVPCEEALPIAEAIPEEEDGDRTVSLPGTSLIRNRGLMSAIVAVGQAATGFLTLTTLKRRPRTAALVFTALGVLVPVLGLLSVVVLGFVIYAIAFSAVSREIWPGKPRQGEA
ncbi:MAG: hypothetical protein ACRD0O_03725 [Acidimicrobiia bacterium]